MTSHRAGRVNGSMALHLRVPAQRVVEEHHDVRRSPAEDRADPLDGNGIERLRRAGVSEVLRLDAEQLPSRLDHLNRSSLWQALNVLAVAARTARQRYGSTVPPWSLIGLYLRGQLVAPLQQSTARQTVPPSR